MNAICRDCGDTTGFLEEKGTQTGLYCSKCGKWIKWVGKNELRKFKAETGYTCGANMKKPSSLSAMDKVRAEERFEYEKALSKLKRIQDIIDNTNQWSRGDTVVMAQGFCDIAKVMLEE